MIHLKAWQEFEYKNENRILCYAGDVINDGWDNVNAITTDETDGFANVVGGFDALGGLDVLPASFGFPVSNYGERFVSGSFFFNLETHSSHVFDQTLGWLQFSESVSNSL